MKKRKGPLAAARYIRSPRGHKARWTQTGGPVSLLVSATLFAVPAWPQQKPPDLTDRSIEDLMSIEVTSVSKKEQKLSQTGAAVFVITAEDLRRSRRHQHTRSSAHGSRAGGVPAYTRLDTSLTWRPRNALSFSAVGQNLLQDEHLEFNAPSQIVSSSLSKRSVYAKIVWHF